MKVKVSGTITIKYEDIIDVDYDDIEVLKRELTDEETTNTIIDCYWLHEGLQHNIDSIEVVE